MNSTTPYYLIILLLCCITIVKAQPCLPFGITFTTQTAVDNFVVDHPGCTEIQGVLVVASGNNNPITNLQGLSGITKVMGGVYMQHNTQLSNLEGLSSLHTIQGGLHIIENTGLLNLTGLESLEVLNGSLQVKENEGLLSLNGLQGLHLINGSVIIDRNHQLISLHGLDSVGNILGDLDIHYNLGLLNVDHLNKLTTVGGAFKFHFNNSAIHVHGLLSLEYIGGNFDMRGNILLESLNGMENLMAIGEDFYFDGTRLKEINALSALETIGGSVTIRFNSKLATLEGLMNLTSINGELFIRSNSDLLTLYGLDNIDPESITDLTIRNCFRLNICEVASICSYLSMGGNADIAGNEQGCLSVEQVNLACEAVEDETICLLQGITISRQGQLDSFAINYPGCVHILGNVTIQSGTQDPINNVGGLNHIETIGGDLIIRQNSSLIYLHGFDSLQWIGGSLRITMNAMLVEILGFNNVTEIATALDVQVLSQTNSMNAFSKLTTVGSNFRLSQSSAVENFGNFEALEFVGGTFRLGNFISENMSEFNQLKHISNRLYLRIMHGTINFNGLSSINHIGSLYLEDLMDLQSLAGIENIPKLDGITIRQNTVLTDISALSSISLDSTLFITLTNNPNLSTCNYANICAYLESGYPAHIYNNAPGCNSVEEVLAMCITSSGEVYGFDGEQPELIVFPNPASAYLNIYSPTEIHYKVRVYNITGQVIRAFEFSEKEVMSLNDLPSGFYVLVFEHEGGMIISRKVVIE